MVDEWHDLISKTVMLGTEFARCGAAGTKRPYRAAATIAVLPNALLMAAEKVIE
jgi:hypothetical protein